MKTKKTRRSLLWGLLLAGFAGTLTVATHPVRAEAVTSSAVAAATADASGSAKPYFWTEAAHAAVQAVTDVARGIISGQLISDDFPSQYWVGTTGVATSAYHGLPERALD